MELQQALDLVLQELPKGTYDRQLDLFQQAIISRRKVLTLSKGYQLVAGDIVAFNNKTKPRYLIGIQARVEKINQTTAYCRIVDSELDKLPAEARFGGGRIRVPFSLIDRV